MMAVPAFAQAPAFAHAPALALVFALAAGLAIALAAWRPGPLRAAAAVLLLASSLAAPARPLLLLVALPCIAALSRHSRAGLDEARCIGPSAVAGLVLRAAWPGLAAGALLCLSLSLLPPPWGPIPALATAALCLLAIP